MRLLQERLFFCAAATARARARHIIPPLRAADFGDGPLALLLVADQNRRLGELPGRVTQQPRTAAALSVPTDHRQRMDLGQVTTQLHRMREWLLSRLPIRGAGGKEGTWCERDEGGKLNVASAAKWGMV